MIVPRPSPLFRRLVLSLLPTFAAAQAVTFEPFTGLYPDMKGNVSVGRGGRVTVIGVAETTSTWSEYFPATTASDVFVVTREPGETTSRIQHVGQKRINYNFGLGGAYASFAATYAENPSGLRLLALREQSKYLSDVMFPRIWPPPELAVYRVLPDSVQPLVRMFQGDHPDMRADSSGGIHLVWEVLSPLPDWHDIYNYYGTDSNYYFTRSDVMYARWSPDGTMDSAIVIGQGYRPRVHCWGNGAYVVWLRADSSNASAFDLVVTEVRGGSVSGPVVLADTLQPLIEIERSTLPPSVTSFVDGAGGLHAGWSDYDWYEITGLHYVWLPGPVLASASGAIRSDTVVGRDSPLDLGIPAFHVDQAGKARAAWTMRLDGALVLRYSAADAEGRLFRNDHDLMPLNGWDHRVSLFTDSQGRAGCLTSANEPGIRYARDIDSDRDTTLMLSGSHSITRTLSSDAGDFFRTDQVPLAIDAQDQVWLLVTGQTPGLFKVEKQTTVVPDGADSEPALPWLSQNYPNPFNPRTEISYQMSEGRHVRLSVLDILGREVDVLVDSALPSGEHTVVWDASRFPSGMYICLLRSGGHVETRKLMLLK